MKKFKLFVLLVLVTLLALPIFSLSGCKRNLPQKDDSDTSLDSNENFQVQQYIDELILTFKKDNLISNVNTNFDSKKDLNTEETYEKAIDIIEFDIEEEKEVEAKNDMKTGKLILFDSITELNEFINIISSRQLIDDINVDTNEISPVLISDKEHLIILQLNQSISKNKIETFKEIVENK